MQTDNFLTDTYSKSSYIAWYYQGSVLGYLSRRLADALCRSESQSFWSVQRQNLKVDNIERFVQSATECIQEVWNDTPVTENVTLFSTRGIPELDIPRNVARYLGVELEFVRLVAIEPPSHIILSQRAYTKKVAPGKWEHLVGGGVIASEGLREALMREAYEEAGLLKESLLNSVYKGSFYTESEDISLGQVLRDRHHVWLLPDASISTIICRDKTIESFKSVSLTVLYSELVGNPERYLDSTLLTLKKALGDF